MNDYSYRILIYIHVLSAVSSIGPFFLLLAIVNKLSYAKETVMHTYLLIFKYAVSIVKHSGHVLVISGALLIYLGPWTWKTPWIVMTLIVLLASSLFLARAFTPVLKLFYQKDANKIQLTKKLRRTTWIYLLLLIVMLWFMVDKPIFW